MPFRRFNMGDDLPEFVNAELVEAVWRRYLGDNQLVVKDCALSLVGAKGDNYSSIMCRAVCTVTHGDGHNSERRMVIKTMPTGAAAVKYVTRSQAFQKEIKMLEECLPNMQIILASIGETTPLGPKIYYAQTEPQLLIAMEDLSVSGFSVSDRAVGLSSEECLAVANSLAAFHAASILLMKQKPELKQDFKETIWGANNRENLDSGLKYAFETIVENIDSWSSEKWSDKLKLVQKSIPEGLYQVTGRVDARRPVVLNHGDLWLNNIMFQQRQVPLQLRFVDLQLSWTNSPVFDLMYFLFTSPRPELRFTQMDSFLETYHARFTKMCELLKLPLQYSLHDLKEDMRNNLFFGFCMFYFVFAITAAPPKDAVDTSTESDDVMKGNNIFKSKFFQKSFLGGLPFFEKQGLFKGK